jgi:hypothetical protein
VRNFGGAGRMEQPARAFDIDLLRVFGGAARCMDDHIDARERGGQAGAALDVGLAPFGGDACRCGVPAHDSNSVSSAGQAWHERATEAARAAGYEHACHCEAPRIIVFTSQKLARKRDD